MCLYVDRKVHETAYTPLKAHRDIKCYKALIACYNPATKEVDYISPFYAKDWKIGEIQEATQIWNRNKSIVEDGYFHSYSLEEDAQKLARSLRYPPVIAKCIIPEGSEYYVGTDNECKPCYASKQLVVKEIKEAKDFRAMGIKKGAE